MWPARSGCIRPKGAALGSLHCLQEGHPEISWAAPTCTLREAQEWRLKTLEPIPASLTADAGAEALEAA